MISKLVKNASASKFREACQIAFLVMDVQVTQCYDHQTHVFTVMPLQKVSKNDSKIT